VLQLLPQQLVSGGPFGAVTKWSGETHPGSKAQSTLYPRGVPYQCLVEQALKGNMLALNKSLSTRWQSSGGDDPTGGKRLCCNIAYRLAQLDPRPMKGAMRLPRRDAIGRISMLFME
jgi:hypothetical protein